MKSTNTPTSATKSYVSFAQAFLVGALCLNLCTAAFGIEYVYNTDNNTIILENYPTLTQDFVSGGTNGAAATGNRIIMKGDGNLFVAVRGDTLNFINPYASGFESMTIDGPEWLIGTNVTLTGTGATTFHVVSGSHTIGGPLSGAGTVEALLGDGPKTTINAGAALIIGNRGAVGNLLTDGVVNNGTLIFARTNYEFNDTISGSGRVIKATVAENSNLTLSSINTFTGGTFIESGGIIATNPFALGTGRVDFLIANCTLYMRLDTPADVVFSNELTGNGRVRVDLGSSTNVFSFGDGVGTRFVGNFQIEQGVLDLSGSAGTSALANSTLFVSATGGVISPTVLVGSGTKNVGNLVLGTYRINNTNWHTVSAGELVFDVDIANHEAPVGNSHLSVRNFTLDSYLQVSSTATIRLANTSASPISVPALSGVSLFEQDDANIITQLISASGSVSVNTSRFILADANNVVITNEQNHDLVQGTSGTVAKATYDYRLTTGPRNDGLYVNYGLTNLELLSGKTLELKNSGTGGIAANSLGARFTGSGGLDIYATGVMTLNGVGSTYTGSTTVNSGRVVLGENNAFGNTAKLRIKPDAQVDLNGRRLLVAGSLVTDNNASIDINGGYLLLQVKATSGDTVIAPNSLSGEGTFRIEIPSTGTSQVIFEGDNPIFSAIVSVANQSKESKVVLKSADALGTGVINAGYSGTFLYQNVSGDLRVSSSNNTGFLVLNSSTLQMTGVIRGNTKIENSDITFGPTSSMAGTGIISVDKDSILRINIPQSTATNPLVFDGGTLDFVAPTLAVAPRLTINDLRGSGTIFTNVNPNTGASNVITFKKSTGNFDLNVRFMEEAKTAEQVMPIYAISGTEANATIALVNNQVESGVYVFKLMQGTGDNILMPDKGMWYLAADQGEVSRAAKAIVATAAVIGAEWHYSLDSVSKRMGDLRQEFRSGKKSPKGNLWARIGNQTINTTESLCGAAFDEEFWVLNAGVDTSFRSASATTFVGLFGGVGRADRIFKNLGDGESDSISVGMYLTWLADNGWYIDVVGKDDMIKNKFHSISSDGLRTNAAYDGDVLGLSTELGKQIYLGKGKHWWVEPSLQVAYATLKSDDYTTDTGIDVKINSGNSQQYRAQLRFGYYDKGARFQPYAKFAAVYNTSSGSEIVADERELQADFDGLRLEAGVGGSYIINAKNQVYLEYEYARADTYERKWSINVGYRHAW